MIVCSCHAVTDREIRSAVCAGARSVVQVARACGAGGTCGGCHESLHEILAEASEPFALPQSGARMSAGDFAPA